MSINRISSFRLTIQSRATVALRYRPEEHFSQREFVRQTGQAVSFQQ